MKTMKQFTEEWNGRKEGAITVNRCFSFKSWLGDDRKVFVAAQYDDFSRTWEAVHAEYADNGEDIEMNSAIGDTKDELESAVLGLTC